MSFPAPAPAPAPSGSAPTPLLKPPANQSAPAVTGPVLAAFAWPTNADLIVDVVRLGYLHDDWEVLDPTFGRGLWWTKWRPSHLYASDISTGTDFRCLPHGDRRFDAVAFDPPYVCPGGRQTTTVPDLYDRYGLFHTPRTPALLQEMIDQGVEECLRVLRPGGLLLVKCQDYVSSGRLWAGTHRTLSAALACGAELVDRFEHVGRVRPQPSGRRQVHARRNLSTLLVLKR